MSLRRIVWQYGSAGAVAALSGWGVAQGLGRFEGSIWPYLGEPMTRALVGGALGSVVGWLAGPAGADLRTRSGPVVAGMATGSLLGAIGASLARLLLAFVPWGREIGWTILGAGVGAAEGFYQRDPGGLRRGIIAGTIGGLLGGLAYGPIHDLLSRWTVTGSRALAFMVIGASVSGLTGFVRFAMARGRLVFGDGRAIPLGSRPLILGKAGNAALGVAPRSDEEAEPRHARVTPRPDGRYFVEDLRSRRGTFVNRSRVAGAVLLGDGDEIGIGSAIVLFRSRERAWWKEVLFPNAGVLPAPSTTTPPTAARATAPGPVATKPTAPTPAQPSRTSPQPTRPMTPPSARTQGKPTSPSPAQNKPIRAARCPKCNRFVTGEPPYCQNCRLAL